jgi:hypothetical protein
VTLFWVIADWQFAPENIFHYYFVLGLEYWRGCHAKAHLGREVGRLVWVCRNFGGKITDPMGTLVNGQLSKFLNGHIIKWAKFLLNFTKTKWEHFIFY